MREKAGLTENTTVGLVAAIISRRYLPASGSTAVAADTLRCHREHGVDLEALRLQELAQSRGRGASQWELDFLADYVSVSTMPMRGR